MKKGDTPWPRRKPIIGVTIAPSTLVALDEMVELELEQWTEGESNKPSRSSVVDTAIRELAKKRL